MTPALEELGIEQPLGGIVDDRDECLAGPGQQSQPRMGTAIEVQQLTEAGPGLAAAAMAAAGPAFGQQPGALQRPLDERVAERDAVVAPETRS
jgi:hypothetical protein